MNGTNRDQEGDPNIVPLIINGKDIITTTTFEIIDPTTGKVIHQCSSAAVTDADNAAETARAAFPAWSALKPIARRDYLLEAARIMEQRKEELIGYQQQETGAARLFAELTANLGIQMLKDVAGRILSLEGTVPTVAENGQSAMVVKEPQVRSMLTCPLRNAPLILGIRAVALPIAAGNTTVLKGSELCPKVFWAIGDIFRQAGLPAGCVNVIYHRPLDAEQITSALIAHPAIKKINFTGSTHVGSIIMSLAAKHIKPVLPELGGKAACIVLDDADLNQAAVSAVVGAFLHSGQVCMSTERIIVQRSVADQFSQILSEKVAEVLASVAPTTYLATSIAAKKNRQLISDALSKGGKIWFGGLDEKGASTTSVPPTIVGNLSPEMDLYHTESFGPTASLHIVDTEDDAVALANDTQYGLVAAVHTQDLRRGFRVARRIESGAVHINSPTIHDEPTLPHGGVKASGFGRFGGSRGLDEFLQTKTITWMD